MNTIWLISCRPAAARTSMQVSPGSTISAGTGWGCGTSENDTPLGSPCQYQLGASMGLPIPRTRGLTYFMSKLPNRFSRTM